MSFSWSDFYLYDKSYNFLTTFGALISTDSDVDMSVESSQLMPRKVGEAIGSTVGALANIVNYPLGKDVFVQSFNQIPCTVFPTHNYTTVQCALAITILICL